MSDTTTTVAAPTPTTNRSPRKSANAKRPAQAHKGKTSKREKAKPFARAFGNDQPNRTINASELFRKAFKAGQPIRKAVAVASLVGKGVKPATVASFLTWAKRETAGTPDHANPWGFRLVETRNGKEEKILKRVAL